ncbi:hypothetical protein GN316_19745 [Xylophilus sp. Kf1]|nr:hypothetical protein [Xylophilus sp. Kf1]
MNSNQEKQGDTRAAEQDQSGGRVPRTPNEHDTSVDSQKDAQPGDNANGKQAHRDATGGQQDTDKGAVMDETYEKVQRGT